MQKVQIGNYVSNSRSHDGSIIFNKSNTDTPYFRFGAHATLGGKETAILLFLNAQQCKNLAVMPELLQGKTISIDDAEWDRAVSAERNPDYADQNAMAFTNFTIEDIDMDIIDIKVNRENQLVIAQAKEATAQRERKRSSFLQRVKSGQEPDRFGYNRRGTDQLTGTGTAAEDVQDTGKTSASQQNTKGAGNVTQAVK
jgi:hypothetical protein